MDFADFDLSGASEQGTWLHLDLDGKLYRQEDDTISTKASKRPCRVKIRGLVSSGVMDLFQKIERMEMAHQIKANRTKDKDLEALVERHQTAIREVMAEIIVAAVASWENIVEKGKEIEPTRENVLRILGPQRMFFKQVNDEILEMRRFLKPAAQG